ncbi:hypothetical protein NC652_004460 [Populus alba x Populus x berolinensis]|uniref:Uncharacterized protein n=1 Tax=Populus alba x Populus x berolinensis TaxID=444605 RepID=A0AAD6RUB3_9ROSI|nr:hypothetical protein NC651_004349 [Populus alba x Populus x berolinensis]KAJ6966897.1 hypothetical protein NC652_004460 [Populus alba x Populus x berolinensis]KAJ7015107.1 hypothetical protein NC653_004418 [Populus alba x Populus x berolinensis]
MVALPQQSRIFLLEMECMGRQTCYIFIVIMIVWTCSRCER